MNAVLSMRPGSAGIAEHDHLAVLAHPGPPESRRPLVDVSAELLRTIAEVLDIRGVFPRVSEIVQHVLRHDALELVLCDRSGAGDARGPIDGRSDRSSRVRGK